VKEKQTKVKDGGLVVVVYWVWDFEVGP